VSALTVCSAYFGRIGNLHETERAIQQADEVLTYFARYSRQGKRYGLILKKLSNAAVDYHQSLKQRHSKSRNIRMPEMFRLNLPLSGLVSDSNKNFRENRPHPGQRFSYIPEQTQQPSLGGDSFTDEYQDTAQASDAMQETQNDSISQHVETDATSSMINNASLLDLAQTFNDMSHVSGFGNLTIPGNLEDFHVDLERAGDIWDLDWGDTLL
jgi:hypothetical protein